MAVKCSACPLRRLPAFKAFTEDEAQFMERFKSGELSVDPGTTIMMEGTRSPQLYTALRGLGLRYKTLENGERQVLNFIFPGDFIGMQAGILGEMDHSVEATTAMTLCVFNRADLWSLFRLQPSLAFDLTWLAAAEEHFLGEALATVGQRSAIERVAWAMMRIHGRATALKLAHGGIISFPYRQQDLADALGLSLVHTNKTLAKLRERQIAGWSDGELRIIKLDELATIAGVPIGEPRARHLL